MREVERMMKYSRSAAQRLSRSGIYLFIPFLGKESDGQTKIGKLIREKSHTKDQQDPNKRYTFHFRAIQIKLSISGTVPDYALNIHSNSAFKQYNESIVNFDSRKTAKQLIMEEGKIKFYLQRKNCFILFAYIE